MNRLLLVVLLVIGVVSGIVVFYSVDRDKHEPKQAPNDWFFRQRAYPYEEINYEARKGAWERAQQFNASHLERGEGWVFRGPLNIGGRISAVAMHPENPQLIYVGAASGGIFKTVDGGGSWEPVFDDALSLSIGDIKLAPSDPSIIYVGTGEANAGGGSMTYDGPT